MFPSAVAIEFHLRLRFSTLPFGDLSRDRASVNDNLVQCVLY